MENEIRVLNRTLRRTDSGITYEPDQRHAEIIVKEFNLFRMQQERNGATQIRTKTCKPSWHSSSSRQSRGIARKGQQRVHGQTRCVTISCSFCPIEVPDLQFAAKQASRYMATPRVSDWALLKRTARYLVVCPSSVQTIRWQVPPSMVTTFTDSDWDGDRSSRKSTSGGVVCLGHHVMKSWSSTQQLEALSSGKAELYALIKGASQTKGVILMLVDFGSDIRWYSLHRCISGNGNLISKEFRPHSPFGRPIPLDSRRGGRGTSESPQSWNQRESGRYLDELWRATSC